MFKKSLTEIANHYGTDKGTIGPSERWQANNITDIYEAYFEKYRSSNINLLEIGTGVTGDKWDSRIVQERNTGGASIKMWYEYFPNGIIYGIDINQSSFLDNERIKTYVVDQSSVTDLEEFTKAMNEVEFDFVIDDGSHRSDHQQISFSFLFKKLKKGALYFIEDLLHGERSKGRNASQDTKSTREVFKYFKLHGEFPEPNVLSNISYLKENIANICFHIPSITIKLIPRINPKHPFKKLTKYKSNSELLCVIRKK